MTWRTALWLAFRGGRSDRLRIVLTAGATALATVFVLLSAAFLDAAGDTRATESLTVWRAGLAGPGALALLLLALVGLGLAAECGRVGEPVRRRRMRDLALLGLGRRSLRWLAALEGGAASVAGVVAGIVLYGLVALGANHVGGPYGVWDADGHRIGWAWDPEVHLLPTDRAPLWWVVVPGLLVLPLLVTLGAFFAGRPGDAARPPTHPGLRRSSALVVLSSVVLVGGLWGGSRAPGTAIGAAVTALAVASWCAVLARASLGLAGASARAIGRVLAGRARTPAALLAARRMSGGEAAGGSGLGTLLVGCVVGGAAVGLHALQVAGLARVATQGNATPWSVVLTLVGVGVATVVGSLGLTVREVEAMVSRRRSLATAVAAGVPRGVLRRAAVLESVLPLVPLIVTASLLGALGAQAVATWWLGMSMVNPFPGLGLLGLLVLGVTGAVVLAAGLATVALPASTDVSEARVPA